MRKFFQDMKADLKFRAAGPGQKLSEPSRYGAANGAGGPCWAASPSRAPSLGTFPGTIPDHPGKAPPSPKIPLQNPLALPFPLRSCVGSARTSHHKPSVPTSTPWAWFCLFQEQQEEVEASPSVSGVYFTCPLTGAVVRKDQREKHLQEAIRAYYSVDPVAASIMEIHTFNKDQEKVRLGVETMAKYLENICLHPEEEKFRKIKLQNKVFQVSPDLPELLSPCWEQIPWEFCCFSQERISSLEGTLRFFQAVGFEVKTLPREPQEQGEQFLVLREDVLGRLQELRARREQLVESGPLRAQLLRQRRLFRPSGRAARRHGVGMEGARRGGQGVGTRCPLCLTGCGAPRSEAVERASMLRTRAMREKEEQRELRRYNYTLLRVRFPDGFILQGTFYARESVSALYDFVREALRDDWLPFELLGPGGLKLTDENLAFNECGLVPSALLSLSWDSALMADIEAAAEKGQPQSLLRPELLAEVETLP
ncbi:UBXN6 protein, partial [Formicarius rufipectus]|nr:UBXN6 protein [Formicarius rufipectus]